MVEVENLAAGVVGRKLSVQIYTAGAFVMIAVSDVNGRICRVAIPAEREREGEARLVMCVMVGEEAVGGARPQGESRYGWGRKHEEAA